MAGVGQTVTRTDRSVAIPVQKQVVNAMALVCQRGPIGRATLVRDWPQFKKLYGGFIDGEVGTYAARRALEAGSWLWVSRVVHLADPNDITSKTSAPGQVAVPDRGTAATHGRTTGSATFPVRLEPGQTLVASVNGAADLTLTFSAAPAQITGSGGTYAAVTAGHRLVMLVNGVQRVVTFSGSEAALEDFHDAIAASLLGCRVGIVGGTNIRMQTDLMGSSATLAVDAATDADVRTALGLAAVPPATGSGNVANIDAVTGAEFTTLGGAAFTGTTVGVDVAGHPFIESGTTGISSTLQVKVASTAVGFGFDNTTHAGAASGAVTAGTFAGASDGTWLHACTLVVTDDPTDPVNRFRVTLTDSTGAVVVDEAGLSVSPTDPANRYVTNVLRAGDWLRYTHSGAGTTAAYRPAAGTYTFAGGNDGLVGLADVDFLGTAAARTGLHAFDTTRGWRVATAPGRTSHAVHAGGSAYCQGSTQGLARWVGSVPRTCASKSDVLDYRQRTGAFTGGPAIDDDHIALYAGWHEVEAEGPSRGRIFIPADGEVLAAIAASGKRGGVWYAPAGTERGKLREGVLSLAIDLAARDVEDLLRAGVNSVYNDPDYGMLLEGNHTTKLTPSVFQSLSVCLLFDLVGEQISIARAPLRYEPNDETLFRDTRNLITKYLDKLKDPQNRAIKGYRTVVSGATSLETRNITDADIEILPIDASEWQRLNLVAVAPDTSLN